MSLQLSIVDAGNIPPKSVRSSLSRAKTPPDCQLHAFSNPDPEPYGLELGGDKIKTD